MRHRSGMSPERLCDSGIVTENYFDEGVAARYDETIGSLGDPRVIESAVDFLAALAGGGAALELGIGTGRIALPLSARGVRVHGIDLSEAMVARLRAKPGGSEIPVTIGDFARARVEGTFSLVYVVFNTIMNLRTQGAQVACFENAASHLERQGLFVVEIMASGVAAVAARRDVSPLRRQCRTSRLRRIRRRAARPDLTPLLPWRGRIRDLPGSLCLAIGARPDGAAGWDDAARALERLEARTVHGC